MKWGGQGDSLEKEDLSKRIWKNIENRGLFSSLLLPNEMWVSEGCFQVYESLNSLVGDLDYGKIGETVLFMLF